MRVSWSELAEKFDTISSNSEMGSSDLATQILESVIGSDFFEGAVEYYVSLSPGCELARSVLSKLRTDTATLHCYKIYKTSTSLSKRVASIELLAAAGTRKALDWIPEFLQDSVPDIQNSAMKILDYLLFFNVVSDEDVEDLYRLASTSSNSYVRDIGLANLCD